MNLYSPNQQQQIQSIHSVNRLSDVLNLNRLFIMSQLTLFWSLGSQPGRAVKALVDIGKIECELVNVDLLRREQRSKEYLQMYPLGKVPVLKKGQLVIGESGAIMTYFCETNPHIMSFYGSSIEEKAIVNQFISWYQNYFRPRMFKPIRQMLGSILMQLPIKEDHKRSLESDMMEAVQTFDHILAKKGTKFVAGSSPSIADLLFFFEMTNLVLFGKNHDQYSHIKRWFAQVYRIPEVMKITHEWHPTGKATAQMFASVQVAKSKL